jgi:hypothetical protein
VPLSLQVNLSNNWDHGGLADDRKYSFWTNCVKHCLSIFTTLAGGAVKLLPNALNHGAGGL